MSNKTAKNLLISYAGEMQAWGRYTQYAKIAKKEGYVQIQNIFLETARNEFEHAKRFFRFANELSEEKAEEVNWTYPLDLGNTAENLAAAAAGEYEEHSNMYPEFADIAEAEGYDEIAYVWREIAEVEEAHETRFRKLLANIENDRVFSRDEEVQWICQNCGYIHTGKTAPVECPACAHAQEHFKLFVEDY